MKHISGVRVPRRAFLQRTASLAAAPWLIPASALGVSERPAPSNRVALGFIGVGAMGTLHFRAFLDEPAVQVLAVCEVDRWRREHAQAAAERTYAAQRTSGAYRGCTVYRDLRELLARNDIDAVVVATGDRWHALATVLACKAGQDVYCEKPASLTIAEARAMVATVRRYGRVCQIGLQQRSAPEFRLACQLVRDGALGRIRNVYVHFPGTSGEVDLPAEPVPEGLDWDLWLGPAPWRPFNRAFHHYGQPRQVVPWHFCRDFGGGNLTSNAVHALDIVQWALGMDHAGPTKIVPPETGQRPDLTYEYPGGVMLHVVDRRLNSEHHTIPNGWNENTSLQNFGALFVGECGWIHVGRNGYFEAFPLGIVEAYPARYEHAIAVRNHRRNWLEAIRTRGQPACDVSIGCRSTIVSHLGCIAYWTGKALKWDPVEERFDDDEANRQRGRAMREPWRL